MNGYSIWLDLEKESRTNYRNIISTLSRRLNSPLFEPHCTVYGHMKMDLSELKTFISKIILKSNQFSTSAKKVKVGSSYFKSLSIKIDCNPKLQDLNNRCKSRFSLVKKYKFDPHISLAYGLFKTEKIHNVMKNIVIPKHVVFSGLSIVKTGKDVEKWETVFQRKF